MLSLHSRVLRRLVMHVPRVTPSHKNLMRLAQSKAFSAFIWFSYQLGGESLVDIFRRLDYNGS